jgi:hypothetical protein
MILMKKLPMLRGNMRCIAIIWYRKTDNNSEKSKTIVYFFLLIFDRVLLMTD